MWDDIFIRFRSSFIILKINFLTDVERQAYGFCTNDWQRSKIIEFKLEMKNERKVACPNINLNLEWSSKDKNLLNFPKKEIDDADESDYCIQITELSQP